MLIEREHPIKKAPLLDLIVERDQGKQKKARREKSDTVYRTSGGRSAIYGIFGIRDLDFVEVYLLKINFHIEK